MPAWAAHEARSSRCPTGLEPASSDVPRVEIRKAPRPARVSGPCGRRAGASHASDVKASQAFGKPLKRPA
ncbi:hypothetical protein HMPREF0972_01489 [Actinomyces sp. oral taxon 848 str. F0332]|nr:hypothetical protein HMPREF0972_01489 [Actinomyces sp. oral taxon 848 str. F0332]